MSLISITTNVVARIRTLDTRRSNQVCNTGLDVVCTIWRGSMLFSRCIFIAMLAAVCPSALICALSSHFFLASIYVSYFDRNLYDINQYWIYELSASVAYWVIAHPLRANVPAWHVGMWHILYREFLSFANCFDLLLKFDFVV